MAFHFWEFHKPHAQRTTTIEEKYSIPSFLAGILSGRNLSDDEIEERFVQQELSDPFTLKDMDKAVERINLALDRDEKVAVFGDYDCDGITASYILTYYLESLGLNVLCYIPERKDGYGLTDSAVREIVSENVSLMITVDNGITACEEIALANQLGLDVIVTDHHAVPQKLPEAIAVIDPHRPDCPSSFKDLAGVGVAFKLIAALQDGDYESAFEIGGDFAAIGTIADVMPLIGENRLIVTRGLRLLSFTENEGLLALMQQARVSRDKITSGMVAFVLAPRINAAGRFNQARLALELFRAEDAQRAEEIAASLEELVQKRKAIETQILHEIYLKMQAEPRSYYDRILLFAGDWPPGVIGTVSSRLVEQFGKPAIVFSIDGDKAHGSARSLEKFSIYEALKANETLFERWGGHQQAAGMTLPVEKLPLLKKGLEEYAAAQKSYPLCQVYHIDAELNASEVSLEKAKELAIFEPFGHANPLPLFLLRNAKIEKITPLSGGKHQKCTFSVGEKRMQGLIFGVSTEQFHFRVGDVTNLLVQLSVKSFRGEETVSMQIKDMRKASFSQKRFLLSKVYFEKFMRGEALKEEQKIHMLPQRKDFITLYRMLYKHPFFSGSKEDLFSMLEDQTLSYCKFCVAIEVFVQGGLVEVSADGLTIQLKKVEKKIDLEKFSLLQQLQ